MKRVFFALLILTAAPAFAQFQAGGFAPRDYAKEEQDREDAEQRFLPADAWRVVQGKTVYAKGAGWVQFQGTVTGVLTNGIIVTGGTGIPGDPRIDYLSDEVFFIHHFPYRVADGDRLYGGKGLTAKAEGTFSYNTAMGAAATIHAFDYGTVYVPPPPKPLTPEQIASAKAKEQAARKAGQEKALAFNQSQADKGDITGQLRMGERYRDGEGEPRDLAKAREYFTKAAAQGSPEAATALKNLP